MSELLTQKPEESAKLQEFLNETVFRSVKEFISAYDEGFINRQNDQVKEIADRIVDIYQNVELKNREFVFVSQSEILTEELLEGLQPWRIITKIKRAIQDSIEENNLNQDVVYFSSDHVGYICVSNDNDELERLSPEKFFTSIKAFYPVYEKLSSYYSQYPNPEEPENDTLPDFTDEHESEEIRNAYAFKVEDFIDVDDSFIERMYEIFK